MGQKSKTKSAQLIVELERKLKEALAGQTHVYMHACEGVSKAGRDRFMGSGVVITLTALGGRELIPPTLLRDGLSDELIEALIKNFHYGYEMSTLYKPKGIEKYETQNQT